MRHDNPSPRVRFPWSFMGVGGLLILATAGLSSSAPAAGGSNELGVWFNDSGRGAVEIRPCGTSGADARKLCGFIVWLKNPNFKDGRPLTDGYNSDPSKRKRPICGLPVLGNLQRSSEGGYDFGWVYDPEQGQAFDAAIQLHSADRLILTGYKGVKFFSKSFVWKRAPADLPRCDGNTTSRDTKGATVGATQPAAPAATTKAAPAAPAHAAVTDKAKVATPAAQPAAEKSKVAATTPAVTTRATTVPPAAATVVAAAPATIPAETPSDTEAATESAPAKASTAAPAQPAAMTDKPKVAAAAPPAAPAATAPATMAPTPAFGAALAQTTAEAEIVPPRPVPAVRPQHAPIE